MGVRLLFDDQPRGAHIGPEFFAGLEAIHARVGAAVLVDMGGFIQHGDDLQPVAFPDLEVVGVVAGGDLQRPGAELAVHILVGDDGDFAPQDGHDGLFADELLVARVLGVDGHGGIAQDGLRAGGRHRDVRRFSVGAGLRRAIISDHVLEVVQRALLLVVLHLQIGDGGFQPRGPVDQPRAAVNQPFFVQAHKGFTHGFGEALVQREPLAAPIAGGPQAADLAGDVPAVLLFPGPGAFEKLLAPDFLAAGALRFQGAFHLQLRGDSGMVGARHPQGGNALHAVVADHQVFHADEHGMPEMQFAGHVGRGDRDHKGLLCGVMPRLVGVVDRLEVAVFLPHLVDAFFGFFEIVGFG